MFCAGDEFLNTQGGNNNPYNQDNETTWLDWSLLDRHREIFRFLQRMIAFRKSRRSIARGRYWRRDVRWYRRMARWTSGQSRAAWLIASWRALR
jgi:glycogen operon protein